MDWWRQILNKQVKDVCGRRIVKNGGCMKTKERKIWEPLPTLAERIAYGKSQRIKTPREAHASTAYKKAGRADSVKLITDSNVNRVQSLVPIRHERMLQSPFAFFRGAAIVMAEDLSHTPCSGIYVQSCGDCHLFNFGGYATPERNQVFDINDFDETLSAPFEWDLKRLAASLWLAGRHKEFSEKTIRKVVLEAVKMYAAKMRKYSTMHKLEVWYSRLDEKTILKTFKNQLEFTDRIKSASEKAKHRTHEHAFPKLSVLKDGKRRIIDDPPLIYHPPNIDQLLENAQDFFDQYYKSLTDDKKILLQRFRLVDAAIKVVGVGSVGTRCFIALFIAEEDDALILQFKEANSSVLETHMGKTKYKNHGERIVNGQRLMQTVSDIFLGWSRGPEGRNFYVRQLQDMKASANIENFTPAIFANYALLCGWALAKSHAKSGRSPEITGYIGSNDVFAEAITDFAAGYADQTEEDYLKLRSAADNKLIPVHHEN
jgi:uncharacterized protein (DUF2252 family)